MRYQDSGVPSPFVWTVHPWPTRFHGPIYTRPVTGPLIYRTSPQSVFKPEDIWQEKGSSMSGLSGLSGLGELLWETKRGIFGTEEAGGGIFNNGISGLRGLGDDAGYPWREYSTATVGLQGSINLALVAAGYCPIPVDGKLGAGTCAAMIPIGMPPPSTCQGFGTPPKKGPNCGASGGGSGGGGGGTKPPGGSVVPPPTGTKLPGRYSPANMSSETKALVVGGIAAAALIYFMKKRKG